ncbi:MAG TPA: GntR family transcriptional regulator [Stellaceae bacterium]|jgi:DNA-binding GntR family transcriptional regulator|nr:GntR family transcriptional regulator [Stellaceae bacterium]
MSQMLDIHAGLRDRVLSLDLRPGEKLTERLLERDYGASRTPVRAALLKLESEGLMCRDGRSWVVAPIDLGEITLLAEFRATLEASAVRFACERAAAEDIDAIGEMLDRCRPGVPRDEWHKAGTDFHIEIGRLSGNSFLARAVADVMTRLSRPRWLEVLTEPSREQAWAEHRRILDSIRRNQPDAAAQQAVAHVYDTRDRLLRSLDDNRRGFRARGLALVGSGVRAE